MKRLVAAAIISACAVAGAVSAFAAEGLPGATVRPDSGKGQVERQARREQCEANPAECRPGPRPGRGAWAARP